MRRLGGLLLIALLLQGTSAVAAPAGDQPRPRRKPVEAVKAAPRPSVRAAAPPNVSLPADALLSGGIGGGGIAAGGLRSTLPAIGDISAQCRAHCTQTRIFCDAQEATAQCAPRWSMCVTGCGAALR